MYVPGHMLQVGCGSVGFTLPCASSTLVTHAAAATANTMRMSNLLLYGMRLDDLVIQLDAEARAIGNGDRSLHEELMRLEDFRPPIDFAPLELEQTEVLQHGKIGRAHV